MRSPEGEVRPDSLTQCPAGTHSMAGLGLGLFFLIAFVALVGAAFMAGAGMKAKGRKKALLVAGAIFTVLGGLLAGAVLFIVLVTVCAND